MGGVQLRGRSAEPCDLHVVWPTKNNSARFLFVLVFVLRIPTYPHSHSHSRSLPSLREALPVVISDVSPSPGRLSPLIPLSPGRISPSCLSLMASSLGLSLVRAKLSQLSSLTSLPLPVVSPLSSLSLPDGFPPLVSLSLPAPSLSPGRISPERLPLSSLSLTNGSLSLSLGR
ncbi:hypothetical protein AAC387_Pa03g3461 [Persea americana]